MLYVTDAEFIRTKLAVQSMTGTAPQESRHDRG
jgi:hypothetical protein